MTLNKDLRNAIAYTLADEMTIVRVATSYLKDCFGIETNAAELQERGGIGSIGVLDNQAGLFYGQKFYAIADDFWVNCSLLSKETKEGTTYNILSYALPEELAEIYEESKQVAASILTGSLRTLNAAVKKAEYDGVFYPVSLPAGSNGTYTSVSKEPINEDLNRLTIQDDQGVKFSVILSVKVETVGDVFEAKDGQLYNNGNRITGGESVDAMSIPAEIGFEISVKSVALLGSKGAAVMEATDGLYYWAPKMVKDVMRSIFPREMAGFKIRVTGIRTKDQKNYPVCTIV